MRGAALMMGSMAAFVTNDTLIKLASQEMSLFQAILVRGIFATLLIAVVAWRQKALLVRLPPNDRRLVVLRTTGEVGATVCFLTALINMPLANATAILQSVPLALTLAAAIFLKEPVGWRRYAAIIIGFGGVMMIVRPGAADFNSYSLLALAAVGFIVLRELTTYRLSPGIPSLHVAFVASAAILVLGAGGSTLGPWTPMTAYGVIVLAGAGLCLFAGYVLAVMTMRVGEIGFVTPFRYSILIWAIILGMVVFGDIPDVWTVLGITIVVMTGLFTIYRERKLSRQAAAERTRDTTTGHAAARRSEADEG